jgi:hypothetical protein
MIWNMNGKCNVRASIVAAMKARRNNRDAVMMCQQEGRQIFVLGNKLDLVNWLKNWFRSQHLSEENI